MCNRRLGVGIVCKSVFGLDYGHMFVLVYVLSNTLGILGSGSVFRVAEMRILISVI